MVSPAAFAGPGSRVKSASKNRRRPYAVVGLLSNEVHFDESDRHELLETADVSLDRLDRLVSNLLDMSRLQAGAPFQRLGDQDNHTGVGLGLALSRGLTEAMGGRLAPAETPGGGLTMVLSRPAAGGSHPIHGDAR